MTSLPKKVSAYLSSKAINNRKFVWESVPGVNNVVVIPAIAEFDNIKRLLNSLLQNETSFLKNTLFLFVINNAISSDSEIKKNNRLSLDYLHSIMENGLPDELLIENQNRSGFRLGYIDASSPGNEFDDTPGKAGSKNIDHRRC